MIIHMNTIINLIQFLKMKTKTRKAGLKTCTVTGVTTKSTNFYTNQTHLKAVDNLRRNTGATKVQLTRMFNQLNLIK